MPGHYSNRQRKPTICPTCGSSLIERKIMDITTLISTVFSGVDKKTALTQIFDGLDAGIPASKSQIAVLVWNSVGRAAFLRLLANQTAQTHVLAAMASLLATDPAPTA